MNCPTDMIPNAGSAVLVYVVARGNSMVDRPQVKAVRTKGVEVVMLEVAASELEIEAHVGC